MKAKAPAINRGDKLTIELGLVTIGVRLCNAVDESAGKITRSTRTGEGNAVGFSTYNKDTGEQISRDNTYMAYTTEDGVEVELSDEEIAAAMGFDEDDPKAETLGVFPVDALDNYLVNKTYQVRPGTVKVGTKNTRPFDKPFTVFMKALEEKDACVLVQYVSRGKPKLVAIFGDGHAESLHWMNEVREDAELPDVKYDDKELTMAKTLIETLMEPTVPYLENEAYEKVHAYAQAKATGVEIPKQEKKELSTEVTDLMDALQASLEATKK